MSKRIGIVGAGTAGLHLGLYLRQHDVEATVYTDRTPEEYAAGRVPATVAHHAVTVERERALGVDHWPAGRFGYGGHHYALSGPEPVRFRGDLHAPSRGVDYRLYHPRLIEDFTARGGAIEFRALTDDDIATLETRHDLIVVSAGRNTFGKLFPRDPEHSPHSAPQRLLLAGVFKGIAPMPEPGVAFGVSPGHGEMIEIPYVTFGGTASAMVWENHLGSDLEALAHARYDDDPQAFRKLMITKMRDHYPMTAERVDESEFDVANGPLDVLQGGVVPVVRKTSAILPGGTTAIALGDVHATTDPLNGQGANVASYAAWILGEEIVAQEVYDARFVELVDARRRDRVLAANRWTNAMLDAFDTLPPDFLTLMGALAGNRALADEFTDNFNYPERQWDIFASPARVEAWLSRS